MRLNDVDAAQGRCAWRTRHDLNCGLYLRRVAVVLSCQPRKDSFNQSQQSGYLGSKCRRPACLGGNRGYDFAGQSQLTWGMARKLRPQFCRQHRQCTELPCPHPNAAGVDDEPQTASNDDSDRQDFEHPVVPFERRGFAVAHPFGLEDDLWCLAIVGPAGGDAFGALGRAATSGSRVS